MPVVTRCIALQNRLYFRGESPHASTEAEGARTVTLDQLYTQLAPHFPAPRRKDVKTAMKVYAQALGAADPQACPAALYQAPLPTVYRCIDAYLQPQGKSVHTLRNIKNNLSRLFRLAEHEVLLTPAA